MKKILIVNNNLDIGGIQKSLINFLKAIHNQYDVSLLLFSQSGALLNDVPENVKVLSPASCYCMLGLSKDELKAHPFLFIFKAFLMKYAKLFSRRSAMKILGLFQKKLTGYDAVIAYTHLSHHTYFWNGSGDFVLDKTVSHNKICIIHCDYLNSGCLSDNNNREYAEFDKIACCSDSVKERFLQGSDLNPEKVYTLRNFYDLDVLELANDSSYQYDEQYINLVSVARLSPEKGIDRAIEALYGCKRDDIRYYIVGSGPQKGKLQELVSEYNLENQVFFLGEQKNPYRYLVNADYLLVPSLHEAAPMVFDEANVLGLKVITTNTTSAMEMIGTENGIVCENSLDGIISVLSEIKKNAYGKETCNSNQLQNKQFNLIINF